MSYRYEVSYPFLDAARRHGADYGDVLRYAAALRGADGGGSMTISAACADEVYRLVNQPVALRGGRTDVCDLCGATASNGEEGFCQGANDMSKCLWPSDVSCAHVQT